MNAPLPDIARSGAAAALLPLSWVGMDGIALPLRLADAAHGCVSARASVQVNLPRPSVKGIHMSRLYRLLQPHADAAPLSPDALGRLLRAMADSHADCGSDAARAEFRFELLCQRPALATPGLSGWKAYPAALGAELDGDGCRLWAEVEIAYSSTCPCSAALARQLIADAFRQQERAATPDAVYDWLLEHATLATPHSQRSQARLRFDIPADAAGWELAARIDLAEQALATPVQTAVKRADEQAFAALNGANLMYVEDAARRLQAALAGHGLSRVDVRHQESLHPHDAVAASQLPEGLA